VGAGVGLVARDAIRDKNLLNALGNEAKKADIVTLTQKVQEGIQKIETPAFDLVAEAGEIGNFNDYIKVVGRGTHAEAVNLAKNALPVMAIQEGDTIKDIASSVHSTDFFGKLLTNNSLPGNEILDDVKKTVGGHADELHTAVEGAKKMGATGKAAAITAAALAAVAIAYGGHKLHEHQQQQKLEKAFAAEPHIDTLHTDIAAQSQGVERANARGR
jgi:hypothetical protein